MVEGENLTSVVLWPLHVLMVYLYYIDTHVYAKVKHHNFTDD